MKKKNFAESSFNFAIIALAIYFLIRLIDQSKMIWTFPLDYTNDWSSYIAQLFFLAESGFHQITPYWYNGFQNFLIQPPGWYLFTLPFYILTKNILLSTYISFILIFILAYLFIQILCKKNNLSKKKGFIFFILFFANALNIGNFIRLGRIVSLFPFMLLIPFVTILLYYKDKKIDKYFILFIPLYALIIISHFQEAFLFSFLILGLFLVKKTNIERIYIIGSTILAFLITSFWTIPFIINSIKTSILLHTQGIIIWKIKEIEPLTYLISIILPITLFYLFYLFWKKEKTKRDLIFYSPLLFLNFIFLFRLYPFIPFLKNIHPDPFLTLFLFFTIFFFLKLDLKKFTKRIQKWIYFILFIFIILNIVVSIIHTPWFIEHSELEKETINALNQIDGRYLVFSTKESAKTSYARAIYSYSPIFLNLSTADGWYRHVISNEYKELLKNSNIYLKNKNCKNFVNNLYKLNVDYILSYDELCEFMESCNLNEKYKLTRTCVYNLN